MSSKSQGQFQSEEYSKEELYSRLKDTLSCDNSAAEKRVNGGQVAEEEHLSEHA